MSLLQPAWYFLNFWVSLIWNCFAHFGQIRLGSKLGMKAVIITRPFKAYHNRMLDHQSIEAGRTVGEQEIWIYHLPAPHGGTLLPLVAAAAAAGDTAALAVFGTLAVG